MKVRNGFVSNSSSSSFVLFANPINVSEIKDKDVKEGHIVACGRYLSDGEDVFTLDPAILDVIRIYWDDVFSKELEFYWCWYLIESGSTIDLRTVPQDCQVFSLNIDYHSSDTAERLKENYPESSVLHKFIDSF